MNKNYTFQEVWEKCLDYNIEQKPEEFEKLFELLSGQKRKKYALEIGSNFGGTTFALCHIYEKVVAIDIKYDPNFDRIKSEFPNFDYIIMDSKSNDLIEIIKSTGIEFDFIFIDGDHSYEGVKSDYDKFKQFISKEGLIGFHDIIESDINKVMNNRVDILWNSLELGKKYEFIAKERTNQYRTGSLFHRLNEDTPYDVYGGIGVIQPLQISVFVHNYLSNNWIEIVTQQTNRLIESGLYKESDKIFYGVYSDSQNSIGLFREIVSQYDIDKKIDIKVFENNNFEFNTLAALQAHCNFNPDGVCLYYHTKGTSRKRDAIIDSWRECLEYFNIDKWRICVDKIEKEGFDVSGALYVDQFRFLNYIFEKYFSGNFWWSKNSYINKLPSITKLASEDPSNRTIAEMWLGMAEHYWYSQYNISTHSYYEHYFDPKEYKG